MNAIIGLSHLALKTELSAKQRDYISKVHNAGTSLLAVINDILDFSKIEAGKLDLEILAGHALDGIDHFEHGEAAPIAAIERDGSAARAQIHKRIPMRAHEIPHVDIVADAGAVGGGIISPEHLDL